MENENTQAPESNVETTVQPEAAPAVEAKPEVAPVAEVEPKPISENQVVAAKPNKDRKSLMARLRFLKNRRAIAIDEKARGMDKPKGMDDEDFMAFVSKSVTLYAKEIQELEESLK